MNLILIGYRGTGKSTVGRLVAENVGWRFVDTDDLVEQRAGTSIAEIFLHQGEQAFRDLESTVLVKVCDEDHLVIAAGGGIVLREENRRLLDQSGVVVWLTAPVEAIEKRIAADEATSQRRPALTNLGGRMEIEELLALREPMYRKCARHIVDTAGKEPEAIAAEIARLLSLSK